jgi:hypothetical protein
MAYKNVGRSWNATLFGIVAAESGSTIVTITPSVTTSGHTVGVPYNITLTQGQTYLLKNGSSTADLTGTSISATQNVAVFGGNQCANIPAGKTYCDHIVEQLPPLTSWGKEFVTVPLATRLNGDTYQFKCYTA